MANPKSSSESIDTNSTELWHLSFHEDAPETIVLLHGLGTCHAEWTFVWPHLSAYHLLIPDLNGHSKSAHIEPTTIPGNAETVAQLIRTHAHGGRAHIVGLSMGGFTAVELVRKYPDLALSVFSTGAAPYGGFRLWITSQSPLFTALETVTKVAPKWVTDRVNELSYKAQGIAVPEDVKAAVGQNQSAKLSNAVFGSIGTIKPESMKDITVRTLTVAGGRMDAVEATRAQGRAMRESCVESRATVVRKAGHGWNLEFPELFAKGVLAWIQKRNLPEEFEELS